MFGGGDIEPMKPAKPAKPMKPVKPMKPAKRYKEGYVPVTPKDIEQFKKLGVSKEGIAELKREGVEQIVTIGKRPKARGRRFSRQYKKDKKWRKE